MSDVIRMSELSFMRLRLPKLFRLNSDMHIAHSTVTQMELRCPKWIGPSGMTQGNSDVQNDSGGTPAEQELCGSMRPRSLPFVHRLATLFYIVYFWPFRSSTGLATIRDQSGRERFGTQCDGRVPILFLCRRGLVRASVRLPVSCNGNDYNMGFPTLTWAELDPISWECRRGMERKVH